MVKYKARIHLDETSVIEKKFTDSNKTNAKKKALVFLKKTIKEDDITETFQLELEDEKDIFFTKYKEINRA